MSACPHCGSDTSDGRFHGRESEDGPVLCVQAVTAGRVIPEIVVPGKRLGRHVRHDPRSLAYAFQPQAGVPVVSKTWPRSIPILDQGDVGSCTGNAMDGALGTAPLYAALPAGTVLTEAEALRLYSAAETIDGDGPYPPNDNGSSGLSVAQAAKAAGLIAGYTHCLDRATMLQALMSGPVIIGINWYAGFDTPAPDGLVTIAINDYVRGGHEVLVRGVDTVKGRVLADNSWGTSYGVAGSFSIGFATLDRLLAEQGDCTVPLPLSVPAPVPVPTPTPAPGPVDFDPADLALDRVGHGWVLEAHVGHNRTMATAYKAWRKAKGL